MLRTRFPQIHRISLFLLTLLLAFTGSVQAAQTAPAADWQLIINEAEGFQIALPPQWQMLNLSEEALGLGLSLAEAPTAEWQALLDSPAFQQMLINGMKFMAFDFSPAALRYDLPANVNLIKLNVGSDLPITALQTLNERQLAALAEPDYPLESKLVTVHGREAIFFHYAINQEVGFAQTQLTAINQLLLMKDGVQYIVTVAVPYRARLAYQETVAQILASVQLLDGQPAPTPVTSSILQPQPMATPIPTVVAVVQIAKLNVRSGPGTGYAILGAVSQNERLPVTGRPRGRCDWFRVQLPSGQPGWIAGPPKYSTLEGNCSAVPEVTAPLPPTPTTPCVRFDNHFGKDAHVTLRIPGNHEWNQEFTIPPHGKETRCLAAGRYTASVNVPSIGRANDEFTLDRGTLVIPIQ